MARRAALSTRCASFPLDFETAVRAAMATGKPPKAKRRKIAKAKPKNEAKGKRT
jgi:hypothetical protein